MKILFIPGRSGGPPPEPDPLAELRDRGHEIVRASDAAQVLAHLRGDRTEPVLVDLEELGDDPLEVVARLAATDDGPPPFRQLAESLPFVVWTATPAGRVDFVSEDLARLAGISSRELLGRAWFQMIHPDDRDRCRTTWSRAVKEGHEYSVEARILAREGDARWHLVRAAPVPNRSSATARWCGTAIDIHDQKLAEREAHRLADRLTTTLESVTDAFFTVDREWRFSYVNGQGEKVIQRPREEVIGKVIWDEFPDVRGTIFEIEYRRAMESGEVRRFEASYAPLELEAEVHVYPSDEGIAIYLQDVTERKRLLKQFLRAQRMESIGTLAGGIAHDLNNVLSPILMSIGILQLDAEDEETRELLGTIESSARRGADMVRQVLSFARGVEGAQMSVDLTRVLEDFERVIRDTFPRNIALRVHVSEDLWRLVGDPTQIHQILMNLAVNARDAMPDGGTLEIAAGNVVIDEQYAALSGKAAPGTYVRISVADSGTGMTAEVLDHIFEPFFTTKEVGSGTGLGLSTVSAILRSHGGFVNAYSEPGKGTTFKLYLPANHEEDTAAVLEPSSDIPRGRGELILVVDDEPSVREVTRQTLETFGYRAVTAADGVDAVGIYGQRGSEIDLVLTDIMMPVMDGPTTIRALKRMDPGVRVIAASGLGSNGGVARAADLGVEFFLPKPYTAGTLLEIVRKVLDSENHPR